MATAVRRKRDDDSTFHSQHSNNEYLMDASQSSMVALDASTAASTVDNSSLPRRRRKRRRTNLVDQLSQIQINHNGGIPNQIVRTSRRSSPSHGSMLDDNNSQTLTSSEEEDGEEDDANDHGLLSDVEIVQRSVFREFVFGRKPQPPPSNPVERKFQSIVRESIKQVQKGNVTAGNDKKYAPTTQDDMMIETSYARRNSPFHHSATNSTTAAQATTTDIPMHKRRRNSLPRGYRSNIYSHSTESQDNDMGVDVDMEDDSNMMPNDEKGTKT